MSDPVTPTPPATDPVPAQPAPAVLAAQPKAGETGVPYDETVTQERVITDDGKTVTDEKFVPKEKPAA